MEAGESNSTEVVNADSNEDNISRASSGYDEQSESSGESDNDGEPDIDQMLSELEGFQVVRNILLNISGRGFTSENIRVPNYQFLTSAAREFHQIAASQRRLTILLMILAETKFCKFRACADKLHLCWEQ